MADPRLVVNNEGVEPRYRTYLIDGSQITFSATIAGGSAQVGLAVNFSAANTVQLAGDGEAVIGKLIQVESNSVCRVQIGGCMTLPAGTGATLTRGKKIVGAVLIAARGYIREVATATAAELGVARGYISNAAVTTAVELEL
jgi:hypothetical protein